MNDKMNTAAANVARPSNAATAAAAATSSASAASPSPVPPLPVPSQPLPPSSFLSSLNNSLPSPLSRQTIAFLAAGSLARLSSAVLTSPLDTLKVRVQFAQRHPGVRQYASAREAARCMWREEGMIAFYRGLPARLLYIAPAAAVSFVLYEQFKVMFHALPVTNAAMRAATPSDPHHRSPTPPSSPWLVAVPLLLGGVARVIGTTIRTPFDIIKLRMQVQGGLDRYAEEIRNPIDRRQYGVYRHTGEAFIRVIRVEGLRALWAGVGATILRDIPFAVTYFLAYETSKVLQIRYLGGWRQTRVPTPTQTRQSISLSTSSASTPSSNNDDLAAVSVPLSAPLPTQLSAEERRAAGLSAPQFMLSGAMAAAAAVLVTHPMDCCKTRLQTQGSLPAIANPKDMNAIPAAAASPRSYRRYRGVAHVFNVIWREEGWRGFYRGVAPRMLYLMPASAITFTLYETYKRHLIRWMKLDQSYDSRW